MHDDRDAMIRQHLYARGQLSIQELAGITDASVATIRRDLQRLEEKGVVERTHGGARIAGSAGIEVAFEARERDHLGAKRVIAKAAYARLQPDTAIFLDAGTTVLQLARQLRLMPIKLSAFTNSLAVAQMLVGVPGLRVTMLGGQLRPENLSTVGPIAEAAMEALWFDQLFLGASAIQMDGTLSTIDPAEASLNACMLRRASQSCVLADSSKFGLTATYRVARLEAATDMITDSDLAAGWRTRLEDMPVRLEMVALDRMLADA